MRKFGKSSDPIQCAICGKPFVEIPCSIYKIKFAGKNYRCCSYTCYTQGMRAKGVENGAEYLRYRSEQNNGGK